MGTIFSYAITSSMLLCMGYLAYKWILAGERQHAYNRAIIYIIYTLALTLPAFAGGWTNLFNSMSHPNNANVEFGELSGGLILQSSPIDTTTAVVPIILTCLYVAGAVIALIFSISGCLQLTSIIRKGEKTRIGDYILVISERNDVAPFSWLNYYVMSRNDYETAGEIISIHERRHLRLYHWVDLLLVQIVDIFQWFNPAAWLMGEEFKTVHEYQADEAVMASGTNLRQYQTLLIKKAVGTRFQVLANSLNHSKLKKRVTMMYKSKSSKSRRLGALLLIPAMGIGCAVIEIPAVAAALDRTAEVSFTMEGNDKVSDFSTNIVNETEEIASFSEKGSSVEPSNAPIIQETQSESGEEVSSEQNRSKLQDETPKATNVDNTSNESKISTTTNDLSDKEKEKVYAAVDKNAEYPGGIGALMNWLSMNIRYPEKAYKDNIQGKVVVKFIIGKDGKVSDPSILKGVDPELDKEALRVISEMPEWKPAESNGKAVASYYNLPISFKLVDDSEQTEKTETPAVN